MKQVAGNRILVVEDEAVVAFDLEQRLMAMGYRVPAIVASGEDAIIKAESLRPDLVLMDISLKGKVDGLSSAELIHQRFGTAIVFLTAYADEGNIERAMSAEPYGYLVKPFNERELLATIRLALHKHAIEKKARERADWFAVTLNSMTDGLIVSDGAGAVVYMNPAARRITEWEGTTGIGAPFPVVFPISQDVAPGPNVSDETGLPQDATVPIRAALTCLTGRKLAVEFASARLGSAGNGPSGHVTVFRAVEERSVWQDDNGLVRNLNSLLSDRDRLKNLLIICSGCRKVREDEAKWDQFESYLVRHSIAEFSHGICPTCVKERYPELYEKVCGNSGEDTGNSGEVALAGGRT